MHRHRCGRFMHMPPADLELMTLHASAVALARSMRGEPDARRFVEGLSEHLREIIPHDRLLFIPEDGTRVASVPDVERNGPAPRLTLPLQGVDRVIGRLAIANVRPDVYTEAQITIGRRIAEVLGPVVEHIVLLQKERDRLRRMAALPEVSRVLAGSLDVGNIFEQLGAVVRRVLDFDRMIVRPIGPGGALQRTALLVGDLPAALHPEHRLSGVSVAGGAPARGSSWGALPLFARRWTRRLWSPSRIQPSCSPAKAGLGKNWSLVPSTMRADVPRLRSWRSTAPPCPKRWRSPNSSDMSAGPSPARIVSSAVASSWPPAARSSSMRSVISPPRCRRSSSACFKNGSTNGSAARRRFGLMSG